MELSEVVTASSTERPGDAIPVKRAIETVLAYHQIQDLVRVTRSAFSEMHGTYFATLEFPERKVHIQLRGRGEAKAKTEGVMRDYNRDYPGSLMLMRDP